MTDEAEAGDAPAKAKGPTVTRRELALRVQKETGAKLRDVQLIIGATLKVMNDALKAGEQLRLPPFGAARVMRVADPATGTLMRVALREIREKAPNPDRPERPARAPKPAPAPRGKGAGKAGGKRAAAAKLALAANNEAD